ncbi:hypothetical protein [Streptomyces sp. NPDC001948]
MLINHARTAGFDDSTAWDALYEQAADDGNDFVSQVRTVTAHDPEDWHPPVGDLLISGKVLRQEAQP